MTDAKPYLWLIDSDHHPLATCLDAFGAWADTLYFAEPPEPANWERPPDAIFFSAEISGGAAGCVFANLREAAGETPLLAVARLRSLAQAVAYFRAGVADYLSLPVDEDDAMERLAAALEKAERRALAPVLVELESLDEDTGEISLVLSQPLDDRNGGGAENGEDILAGLESAPPAAAVPRPAEAPENDPDSEPVPVDGLPIPTLWEELPCGLLVFDSSGNLVFANTLGMDLFGYASLAELQDALENHRSAFAAHAANHKPLPDNQWPQTLALKARTARSAVISIEKPDKRRVWLRIDCLPHLSEGKITRLSLTLVNMTGELPALVPPGAATVPAAGKKTKTRQRGKRRK